MSNDLPSSSLDDLLAIDVLCDQFEADWFAGRVPTIEAFLCRVPANLRQMAFAELLRLELELSRKPANERSPDSYLKRFPEFSESIVSIFATFSARAVDQHADGPPDFPSVGTHSSASGVPGATADAATGGRFRAVRPHSQGGLGRIWVAIDSELKRQVALKEMIADTVPSPERRERFVLEAEVTGRLEHPGIVPVYGLGMAPDGRPFYAMRFIHGHSLQQAIHEFHRSDKVPGPYSTTRALEFRRLLQRFVAICDAIEFAHSRGIVHRDIKPANVMLGEYGETLVVDWGMAKIIRAENEQPSPDGAQIVQSSQVPETLEQSVFGTPQFMSPEQAVGAISRIGPASDIYSLGATLYQLLTGQPPFANLPIKEAINAVQFGKVVPPRQLIPSIPHSLQAICQKAMALDSADRYASARQFADDIEQWLADEPVIAYQETWWARAGRFTRKHRRIVQMAATALFSIACVATVAAVLINDARMEEFRQRNHAEAKEREARQAQRDAERDRREAVAARESEERQRRLAQEQERRARMATDFLVGIFDSADPLGIRGLGLRRITDQKVSLSTREILDRGKERVDTETNDDPLLQATLYDALGMAYFGQGEIDQAELLISRAWEIRSARLDESHPDILTSKWSRGILKIVASQIEEAESLLREVLTGQESLPDCPKTTISNTQFYLGLTLLEQDRPMEAEMLFRSAMETRDRELGAKHPETGLARTLLIQSLYQQQKTAAAAAEGLKLAEAANPQLAPTLLSFVVQIHKLEQYRSKRDYNESLKISLNLVATSQKTLGDQHPLTLALQFQHAALLEQQGDRHEAERLARTVLERMPLFVARSPRMSEPYFKLGVALSERGDYLTARRYLREAARVGDGVKVRKISWGVKAGIQLADCLREQGEFEEAETVCRDALTRALAIDEQLAENARSTLYSILSAMGRFSEALPIARELYERNWQRRNDSPASAISWATELASCLRETGDFQRASELDDAAFFLARDVAPQLRVGSGVNDLCSIASYLFDNGCATQAHVLLLLAKEEASALTLAGHPDRAALYLSVAENLHKIGQYKEAIQLLREIEPICRQRLGEDHRATQQALLTLALSNQSIGQADEARTLAQEALGLRQRAFGEDNLRTHTFSCQVASLLREQQRFDEAEQLLRTAVDRYVSTLPLLDHRRWQAQLKLADCLMERTKHEETTQILTSIHSTLPSTLPQQLDASSSWRLAEIKSRLGESLSRQQRFQEAEQLMQESLITLNAALPKNSPNVRVAAARLVGHYERMGDLDSARRYQTLTAPPLSVASNTLRIALSTLEVETPPAKSNILNLLTLSMLDFPDFMTTHAVTGDFDGDQRDELFLWNWLTGTNRLLRFQGDGEALSVASSSTFVSSERVAGYSHCVAGDFDGRGRDGLFFWDASSGKNLLLLTRNDPSETLTFDSLLNPGDTRALNGGDFTHVVAAKLGEGGRDHLFFWNPKSGFVGTGSYNSEPMAHGSIHVYRTGIHSNRLGAVQFRELVTIPATRQSDGRGQLFFWNPLSGESLSGTVYRERHGEDILEFHTALRPDLARPHNYENVVVTQTSTPLERTELFFWHPGTGANQRVTLSGRMQSLIEAGVSSNVVSPDSVRDRAFSLLVVGDIDADKQSDLIFVRGQ